MPPSLEKELRSVAKNLGYTVERFIRGRGRYDYAILHSGSRRAFLKAGRVEQHDLDEPKLLYNLQREVWFSSVVHALRARYELPFTCPRVFNTNVRRGGCRDAIGWILSEFIEQQPLAGSSIWDVDQVDKEWTPAQITRFQSAIPLICRTLLTLEQITLETARDIDTPPFPPHRAHRKAAVPIHYLAVIRQKKFLSEKTLTVVLARIKKLGSSTSPFVLGQQDFEVGHLIRKTDNTLVLIDNEFAGWHPRLDSLTYIFHRLWANRRRPDLARALLRQYVEGSVSHHKQAVFFTEFTQLLLPRAVRGLYYDATRRGLDRNHQTQRFRLELIQHLLAQDLASLLSS